MLAKNDKSVDDDGLSISFSNNLGNLMSGNTSRSSLKDLNVNLGTIYCNASRNVGINTVSPAYQLDVNGTMKCNGVTKISNTTNSLSTTNGSLVISGGVGIAKNVYIGGNLIVEGTSNISGGGSGGGTTMTNDINENVLIVNTASSDVGNDGGLMVERYQTTNDNGEGDIVSDSPKYSTTVSSATINTVILASGASVVDDYYNGWWIKLTSGPAINNVRKVVSYVGSTRTLTLDSDFSSIPQSNNNISLYNKSYPILAWQESTNKFIAGFTSVESNVLNVIDYADVVVKSLTFGNTTLDETSIGKITGVTNGTATANKAVVLGISKEISSIGNISSDGILTMNNTTDSTSTSTGVLKVSGGVGISKNVYIGGNLVVTGTVTGVGVGGTTIDSTTDVSARSLTLVGITDSSSVSTGALTISGGVGISRKLYVGDNVNIASTRTLSIGTTSINETDIGQLNNITAGTASASKALVLDSSRNIGTIGNISSDGVITFSNVTDSTSSTTGSVKISGGVGIAKKLYVGDNLNIASTKTLTIGSTSINETDIGQLNSITAGTASASKALVLDSSRNISTIGNITSDGFIIFSNVTDSTSLTTGSVKISGGVGITKNVYIGGNLVVTGTVSGSGVGTVIDATTDITAKSIALVDTTDSTSISTGTLTISGGVGIAKKLYVGDNVNIASTKTLTIGSTSISETDIGKLNGITAGTASASKVLVLDASRNISTIGNLSSDGVITFSNITDSTSTTTGAVKISGGVGIAKKLYVGDNVNIASTKTLTIGSTSINETDIGQLNSITAGTATANKALVLDSSRNIGTIGNLTSDGVITFSNITDSTSTSTGAVKISGGVGITKNVYIGGNLVVSGTVSGTGIGGGSTIDSTTDVTAKTLSLVGTTQSTSISTGVLTVSGGVGITKDVYIGGNLTVTGTVTGTGIGGGGSTGNSINESVVTVNNGATSVGNNGGIMVKRYQIDNNSGTGDVITDTVNTFSIASAGSNSITLVSGYSTIDDYYKGWWFYIQDSNSAFVVARYVTTHSSSLLLANSAFGTTITTSMTATLFKNTSFIAPVSSSTSNTITLDSSASSVDDYYKGWWIKINTGGAINNIRKVSGYVGSTKILTVSSNFSSTPASGDIILFYATNYPSLIWKESIDNFIVGYVVDETNTSNNYKYANMTVNELSVVSEISSISTTTGALVVSGGIGVAKKATIGGKLTVNSGILSQAGISCGSDTSVSSYPLSIFNASGSLTAIGFGKANSTKNSAFLRYDHVSDGSNSNSVTLSVNNGNTTISGNGLGEVILGGSTATAMGKVHIVGTKSYTPYSAIYKETFTTTATFSTIAYPGTVNVALSCEDNILTTGLLMTSDKRLKQNIKSLEFDINNYLSLEPVSFDWKTNNLHDIGFIAQEVLKNGGTVADELVNFIPDDTMENDEIVNDGYRLILKYSKIPIMNYKVIKEQQKTILSLQDKISTLESQLSEVLERLSKLEN